MMAKRLRSSKQCCALLLLCALSLAAPAGGQRVPYILGGDEASTSATPYAASLRVDNTHACGATIVGSKHLLTAAHCVYRNGQLIDASRLTTRVGSTNQYAGGQIYKVSAVTPHPDYFELLNNLALLELSEQLTLTARIQPIEVASGENDLPPAGTAGIIVAGWGRNSEGVTSYKIRELQLSLATEEVCSDAYSAHNQYTFCLAHELQEGICFGDGGGAAVYEGKLIGITSFVVGACGSRYPDVFVRVAPYVDWLQETLNAAQAKQQS